MPSYSDMYFGVMGIWAMAIATVVFTQPVPVEVTYSPSPTTQACTPEGGVSAESTDDNSTGGVTAPEVTWRASGSNSRTFL